MHTVSYVTTPTVPGVTPRDGTVVALNGQVSYAVWHTSILAFSKTGGTHPASSTKARGRPYVEPGVDVPATDEGDPPDGDEFLKHADIRGLPAHDKHDPAFVVQLV